VKDRFEFAGKDLEDSEIDLKLIDNYADRELQRWQIK
jgi:hypothetical protein